MTSGIGQISVQQARFDDFEAYESSLEGWSPVVRKLDSKPFRARLLQVSAGPVRMARTGFNVSLALSGAGPPGCYSFGLPMPMSSPAMWCRESTSDETVSVYPLDGSFEAVTRPGFETVILSVESEWLAELGETLGYELPQGRGPEVLRCRPQQMRALRGLLSDLCGWLVHASALEDGPLVRGALESELPHRLLEALADQRDTPRMVAPHLRQHALRRALEHIAEHPHDALMVADLCRAAGASERTLRRAFRDSLGVGPKSFLQSRRLHGVYRDLRHGAPGKRVTEVAHRWSFWHLGQFAADYRRLFGELPSETLRRA